MIWWIDKCLMIVSLLVNKGTFTKFGCYFFNLFLQILDVAVSLAKVADIDRSLTNEDAAIDGFKEGMKLLDSLKLDSEDSAALEQRVRFFCTTFFLQASQNLSENVIFVNMNAASLCDGVSEEASREA